MDVEVIIQSVLQTHLRGVTVIFVAHRLLSVVKADLIAVLDKGHLVEFDIPLALWHKKGIFYEMVTSSGHRDTISQLLHLNRPLEQHSHTTKVEKTAPTMDKGMKMQSDSDSSDTHPFS